MLAAAGPQRVGRRDEQLRKVDAGGRGAVEGAGRPVGVHAAVAVDGEAETAVGAELLVEAEVRDEEEFRVAVDLAGEQAEGAGETRGVADDLVAAVGIEERQPGVVAFAQEGDAGRVGGDGERVLGKGYAGAGKAL